jgi:hypothetical protein
MIVLYESRKEWGEIREFSVGPNPIVELRGETCSIEKVGVENEYLKYRKRKVKRALKKTSQKG